MRRKSLIIIPIIFFAALFLLRHQVVVVGTKVCLNKTFEQHVGYKDVSSRKGKVVVEGLQVRDKQMLLVVEEMEFGLNFRKVLAHPKGFITLCRKGITNWNEAFIALKRYGNGLSIQNGVLQLEGERYYFQFENGNLAISHDPSLKDHPFLEAYFNVRKDQVSVQLTVQNVPSQRLLRLASFVAPTYLADLQEPQGQIELKAHAVIKKNGELAELSTRFGLENFQVFYPKMEVALQTKKLIGAFNYPKGNRDLPLWKRTECKALLEKGSLIWGEKLALSNLNGNLSLDPNLDPSLFLKGELADEGRPLQLQLEGKGAVHEDQAYWLEFGLSLNNRQGTECGAFLSICRPQANDLVVQLEADNLLAGQVEMLKGYFAKSIPRVKEWEVKEGAIGGKLVALFEKGELAHFEVQDLVGKNIVLAQTNKKEPLCFSTIRGEGRLFDTFNVELALSAPDLFAFISPEFKEAYANYRYDDMAHLSMNIKFGKKEVETSAQVDFIQQKQTVQFGYKSKTPFPASIQEISEGWLHSDRLTHMVYGPFVRLANEDLDLYGTIDLTASYDGKQVDCTLQIDEFLCKHPLLDFKVSSIGEKGKTQGRAKFSYDLGLKKITGTLPIRSGDAYDRMSGIRFQDLYADLSLSSNLIEGKVTHSTILYDQLELLNEAKFDFKYGESFSLTSLLAKIALPSTAEFYLAVDKLDSKSSDCRLLQGKEELAHFVGTKGEIWNGTLNVKPLKEDFEIKFAYDTRTENAILDVAGETIHLFCKKQGVDYVVEKLQLQDLSLKGVIAKAEKGFTLSSFEVMKPNVTLRGAGTVALDLPKDDQGFGVRSDLNLQVDMAAPLPIQLQTTRAFKLAYSPEMGFILSDLDLAGVGCQLNIGQLEYAKAGEHTVANKCTFKVSDEVLARFCAEGALPQFLRDFKLFKSLSGQVNYINQKGKTLVEGIISTHHISLEWKDEAGEFAFGTENEKILFQLHRDAEGFHIDGIKGNLGGLMADLKSQGKEHLKGQVSVNFSSLNELIDLPLNKYLSIWKAGGGYQFDGVFTPQKNLANWFFKGKLKGQDFEWNGYQIDSVEAKLDVEPGKVTLENIDLSDDAGKVWIGEANLTRLKNKVWVFSVPKAEIRNFQPSILTRVGVEVPPSKPLIIKSATLENLKGRIDDLKSISGTGSFTFSNKQLPKLPTQILQKLGLDGALFVPNSGSVQLTLENGKCLFKGVKSVITEKKKSEFEAPRNGEIGYIDFDGNLAIDMMVKQHVARGMTLPLTLQVRGNWNDPQVTIIK
ncbi:MAG: hypothetical protein JSS30_05735 [Verrucomicrobia bacterium]|nr:hypothetical protein [Verrucomicrobiota bacterium]